MCNPISEKLSTAETIDMANLHKLDPRLCKPDVLNSAFKPLENKTLEIFNRIENLNKTIDDLYQKDQEVWSLSVAIWLIIIFIVVLPTAIVALVIGLISGLGPTFIIGVIAAFVGCGLFGGAMIGGSIAVHDDRVRNRKSRASIREEVIHDLISEIEECTIKHPYFWWSRMSPLQKNCQEVENLLRNKPLFLTPSQLAFLQINDSTHNRNLYMPGEGYYETLTKIKNNYQKVKTIEQAINSSEVKLGGMGDSAATGSTIAPIIFSSDINPFVEYLERYDQNHRQQIVN
jgi:hypothetical protein